MDTLMLRRLARKLLTRRRLEAPVRVFLAVTTVLLLCATVLHREDHDGFQASHLFFMPRYTWEMDHGHGMMYEEAYYRRIDMEVLAGEVYGSYSPREYEYEEREYEMRLPAQAPAAATPDPSSTAAYRDWLVSQQEAYTLWFAQHRGEYADWLASEATTFDDWLAAQPSEYRAAQEQELATVENTGDPADEPSTAADALSSGGRIQGHTVRRAPHAPSTGGNTLPIMGTLDDVEAAGWLFEPVALSGNVPASREDDTPSPPPRPAASI